MLRISVSTIWPSQCPKGIHKDSETGNGHPSKLGNQMHNIHRRYPITVTVKRRVGEEYKKHPQPPQVPWIHDQLGKVLSRTATAASVLGFSGELNPHDPHCYPGTSI